MTKALDKAIVIRSVQLEAKTGGKSGDFLRASQLRFPATRPVPKCEGPGPPARVEFISF
jgi:hypothetical protein